MRVRGRVSERTKKGMIECPRCRRLAEADPIQLQGKCSLICPYPNCGFHFYITPKVNGIAQVWEGERANLVE